MPTFNCTGKTEISKDLTVIKIEDHSVLIPLSLLIDMYSLASTIHDPQLLKRIKDVMNGVK